MSVTWTKAAARYQAAQQPGRRKHQPPPGHTKGLLAAFMAGSEGVAARKLLAAADREICLGYSETFSSMTTAVVFTADGLKTHTGVVGMAAAYSKDEPTRKTVTATKALKLLRDWPREGNLLVNGDADDEEALIDNLRRELDKIAAEAP